MSGNLGYIGGGIDLSYGQCARSQGWPRSPYHLLWFGCYRSPGRDGRMKNRFGRLHLGCLQWCLVEECGKLRSARSTVSIPNQPSRVFTRRAALYGGHAQARQLIKSAAALRLTSAHQASRWTGGFAAVARALSGMSNVQCDSLDSATTDVLAHEPVCAIRTYIRQDRAGCCASEWRQRSRRWAICPSPPLRSRCMAPHVG